MNHKLDYSQNFQYDKDYHLAWDVSVDKNMALTSAYGYLAMVNATGNYYLRSNLLNKFLGAGTWFDY